MIIKNITCWNILGSKAIVYVIFYHQEHISTKCKV